MSQRPKYKFTCFKRGHRPLMGVPPNTAIIPDEDANPHIYVSRACRECLVLYLEYVGPASGLVGPDGGGIVTG